MKKPEPMHFSNFQEMYRYIRGMHKAEELPEYVEPKKPKQAKKKKEEKEDVLQAD